VKAPDTWLTRAWCVACSDGLTRTTYAVSAGQAIAQIQRHLDRHGLGEVRGCVPFDPAL
jgi:hypothetical protein